MSQHYSATERQVAYMEYVNRENNYRHHYFDEEMKQYELMKAGDPAAVEESQRMMRANNHGHLSDDPVRDMKYLFVANITITTRFAIEGGMNSETAYNSSDLYICRMDKCNTVEEVLDLHREMFSYFTHRMAGIKKEAVYSRPVLQCMDLISQNLHLPIRTTFLAEQVGLNQSYLSTLFKRETGIAISDYIMAERIETAKNMLRYSDYSASQISEILSFSSQSHFIKSFRKYEGMTPGDYRRYHSADGLQAARDLK